MEQKLIEGTGLVSSRVALGTWSIGGWMWGGSDEGEAIKTIRTALDLGITLIDTAPAYGFGWSEEIVGRAIAEHGERSEEHTSELQSRGHLVCRLLLEKKKHNV